MYTLGLSGSVIGLIFLCISIVCFQSNGKDMIFRRNILSLRADKNNMQVIDRLVKYIVVLLGAAMLTLSGCARYTEIRPTSFRLESVSLHGLRSIDLEVSVGVCNPAGKINLSDIDAQVEHSGKVIGRLTLAPFMLMPKSDTVYRLQGKAELTNELSVMQALSFVKRPEQLRDATVDLSARVKLKSGVSKKVTYNDIPVEKLLKLLEQ
jgi:hypothetical protein